MAPACHGTFFAQKRSLTSHFSSLAAAHEEGREDAAIVAAHVVPDGVGAASISRQGYDASWRARQEEGSRSQIG